MCIRDRCQAQFACRDAARALLDAVHFDVNTLTDTIDGPAPAVLGAATHDIEALCALLALDGAALKSAAAARLGTPALTGLPDFPAAAPLPFRDGAALASYYRAQCYGFFAQSSAFAVRDDGQVSPITHPDTIRLRDLPGYERQKQQILKNTLAFLDGREANNILLYGDKGTGKSSTVKAVVNEYAERGLKIIEMSPRHITCFPKIFAETLRSPFKFIVFLDDLSFSREMCIRDRSHSGSPMRVVSLPSEYAPAPPSPHWMLQSGSSAPPPQKASTAASRSSRLPPRSSTTGA